MQKALEEVNFTLTASMAKSLLKYNNLKRELLDIKKLYNLDKNEKMLLKIQSIENELSSLRYNFIEEFRKNNKEQIKDYLCKKDQN